LTSSTHWYALLIVRVAHHLAAVDNADRPIVS
jgi:hypothetical protein